MKLFTPAGVCYACSISCHGEHELVELFTRRDFVCDCGTTRMPSTSPCTLRANPVTNEKGVDSEEPAATNEYNDNFRNKFCGCKELYDPKKERGTMFQCLGLGSVNAGGCGEDWWHPECLMGLPRDWRKILATSEKTAGETNGDKDAAEQAEDDGEEDNPPGFPDEDDFETFLCYKCVDANPWIKRYAGAKGFLPGLVHDPGRSIDHAHTPAKEPPLEPAPSATTAPSLKRKAEDDTEDSSSSPKKAKTEDQPKSEAASAPTEHAPPACIYKTLPETTASKPVSLFLKEDFRDYICHCPSCFPPLSRHRQLLEEEDTYSPPMSEGSEAGDHTNGGGSAGSTTRSLLDRGEAALSNMDRVKAIEGAMAYNALRDNLRGFLRPFAESGVPVSADDIKAHFEKLRGDSDAIRAARAQSAQDGGQSEDHRREQGGY